MIQTLLPVRFSCPSNRDYKLSPSNRDYKLSPSNRDYKLSPSNRDYKLSASNRNYRLSPSTSQERLIQTRLIRSNFNVGDIRDAKRGLISVKYMSEMRELLIFTAKLVKTG